MCQSNQRTERSQLVTNSINHSTWRRGLHLSALALVVGWLAVSPPARAVCREGCTGVGGTFLGDDATTGHEDTAIGAGALHLRVYRVGNTANGANALYNDTLRGDSNVAGGYNALFNNQTGIFNAANGANALYGNTTGWNVADGDNALFSNEVGKFNTAIGFRALLSKHRVKQHRIGLYAGVISPTAAATSVSVTMFWELLARATPPESATFTPRSPLAGQFTSIPITRSAPLSPRGDSRTRSSPWTRPAK